MKTFIFQKPVGLSSLARRIHAETRELWVGFYRKESGKGGITYPEVLDEALCYGSIDGMRKTVDEVSYTNPFHMAKTEQHCAIESKTSQTSIISSG